MPCYPPKLQLHCAAGAAGAFSRQLLADLLLSTLLPQKSGAAGEQSDEEQAAPAPKKRRVSGEEELQMDEQQVRGWCREGRQGQGCMHARGARSTGR